MGLRTVVNATSHPDAGLSAVPSVVAPLWSLVKGLRGSGVVRAAVSVVGIIAALALQPEPGRPVGVTPMRARALLLSAQARRYLFLQYRDRKSTRLNFSHLVISYAVFCLKKKNKK